jgi:hypothetical protein
MRSFKTAFPPELLQSVQAGTMAYTYKGVHCLKDPFDLVIYLKLIWDLKPKSLIEIGSNQGGGALWFADMLSIAGLGCPVVSIDRVPPTGLTDPRIAFLAGDAARLGDTLTPQLLAALPHPWLVTARTPMTRRWRHCGFSPRRPAPATSSLSRTACSTTSAWPRPMAAARTARSPNFSRAHPLRSGC